MSNPADKLLNMKKESEYLVCVDSDGCVFDSMEIKHKECFAPNFINVFGLQGVAKYAREVWEYVNLYSKTRGVNRYLAIINALDLLEERPEVKARGYKKPDLTPLKVWIESEGKLGNPALEAYIKTHDEEVLKTSLEWSVDVNDTVKKFVRNLPPFADAVESFKKMQGKADVVMVSQTPTEALEREWKEHNIDQYVKVIAGQEMGTKAECIGYAMSRGYAPDHVLMIGDAPGDYAAAKKNGVLYFPINPGDEDNSWKRFFSEAFEKFTSGTYKGEYEDKLIKQFEDCLPSTPPWK